MHAASPAAAVVGAGWLLPGWAVFRSGPANPADGVLLMPAAVSIGAGSYAVRPLPTVGALLLLAAGMGIAWTGNRLIPRVRPSAPFLSYPGGMLVRRRRERPWPR